MNPSSSCLNKFNWISNYGPSFIIPASHCDVLYEPSDFFKELNNIFANAKKRIYISSLYFGTDPYEYELVDKICLHYRIFFFIELD
jgi:phosphatidylserine/phosphatidylglycerophosphate/cardiolipin synthase-like enzyme